jgi:hypothetical protein
MEITQSIDGCLERAIGARGLTRAELQRWTDRLVPRLERLKTEAETRSLPQIRILYETADADAARAAYDRLVAGAARLSGCPAEASIVSSMCFASGPPRYCPYVPSLRTTRWQGTTSGIGLVAHALPAARTALGFPAASATTV